VGIEVNSTNYDPSDILLQDSQFFRDPSSISSINYENNPNYREGTIQSYVSQNLSLPPPPRVHFNRDDTSFIYLQNNYRPQPYYPTPYFCISDNLHFTYSAPHSQQHHRHSHYSCHFFTPNRSANSHSLILSPNNNSLNVNTNPNRINSS